jgi:acetyl-CoA synthetase
MTVTTGCSAVDDVMNVSGHRIPRSRSALVDHKKVAEAAGAAAKTSGRGQAIVAYVTLKGATQRGDARRA